MPLYNHDSIELRHSSSERLWRYQSLARLLWVMQERSLYFARPDTLGDPFEGSFAVANQQRAQIESFQRAARSARATTGVSCWHANDAESDAMWRLYGDPNSTVALRTSLARLKCALADSPAIVFAGSINYVDYRTEVTPTHNAFMPLLRKRLAFAHEREVRLLTSLTESFESETAEIPRGVAVKVDIRELIESIHVAPSASREIIGVVARAIGDAGYPTIPILSSELDVAPSL